MGDPGDRSTNPVTAITFNGAAIHFHAVYNLQHHQRPVPLTPCLHGIVSRLKIPLVGKSVGSGLSPHLIHQSYHRHDITNTVPMA